MTEAGSAVRVLHVDSDPHLGDTVARSLERADDRFDVRTAATVADARAALSPHDVDCIVSEYELPGTDGIAFLEGVRADHPDLPFILYTDEGSEAVASEAISAGVTDYLPKDPATGHETVLANRIANAVEQYRAREAAAETRTKLHQLAENTDDVLFMVDAEWSELLFVNSSYEDIWGGSTDALEDDPGTFLEFVHPGDRELARESMEKLSRGESDVIEYRVVTDDGEQRWVRGESKPIFDDDGSVARIVGFVRDVTARKERERELERYGELVENLPVGVFRTTLDGDIVNTNERFLTLYGADSKAALADTPVTDLYVDDDDRAALLAKLETDGVVEGEQVRMQTLDGERRWMETTLQLVEENGQRYLDGVVQDVTERRERKRSLRRNERRFEAMLEDPHILVGVLDVDGTVLDVNDTAMEYVDAALADVRGEKLWTTPWWVEELRPVVEKYVERAAGGEYVTYEADLEYPSGEPYSVVGVVRPVRDADGTVASLIISARDITGRKKREQQLDAMDRVLRHNLHNELSVVLGAAETIADRAGDDVADLTAMIRSSSEHLLGLASKQRDIVELLTDAPAVTTVPVTEVVRQAVERVSGANPAAELTLGDPPEARARAIPQLDRAVGELLENAVAHADDEAPSVEVDVETAGERVRVSVADTGPRIPPAERAILRGEGEGGPLYHGSGMGLWLVNWVVSQSDGTVTCERNPPSGNVVAVELPAADPDG
jgi:PAS domain S-box-containing protein